LESVRSEWTAIYSGSASEGYRFRTVEAAVRLLKGRVLEAGCGTGDVCFNLERSGSECVGVDLARNAISKAKEKARSKDSNSEFLVADVTWLPIKDSCFTGLVSLGVVEHFRECRDVYRAFREAARVLCDNGKMVCTVPNIIVPVRNSLMGLFGRGLYHRLYTKSYLERAACSCGFKVKA